MKAPKFLQAVLWSYNIDAIDTKQDKELIITQVLNYGDWEKLQWLFQVYPEEDIKDVIKNPGRGIWFDNVLNFWATCYNIHLDPKTYDRAIYEPNKIKEKYLKQN